MALKRYPPLVGGIQQATVVEENETEEAEEVDEDAAEGSDPQAFWVWDGRVDQA
jgi:hypothetical protein